MANGSEDTRARLIEAAGEVFAQHGYRAATVREICRRAGTNVGAVNYHFRDKKGLYSAVLDYSHRQAIRKYPPDAGLGENATPEEKLRAFIRSFLQRILAEGFPTWHGKLIALEIAEPSGAIGEMVENTVRPLFERMTGILRELFQAYRGESEGGDALFLCAMSVVGQCLHHYLARSVIAMLRPGAFGPGDIELLADHITRFSLAGIRAVAGTGPENTLRDGSGEVGR